MSRTPCSFPPRLSVGFLSSPPRTTDHSGQMGPPVERDHRAQGGGRRHHPDLQNGGWPSGAGGTLARERGRGGRSV